MDEEQLAGREELIKTGRLPKGYNALVINAANQKAGIFMKRYSLL